MQFQSLLPRSPVCRALPIQLSPLSEVTSHTLDPVGQDTLVYGWRTWRGVTRKLGECGMGLVRQAQLPKLDRAATLESVVSSVRRRNHTASEIDVNRNDFTLIVGSNIRKSP